MEKGGESRPFLFSGAVLGAVRGRTVSRDSAVSEHFTLLTDS